MTKKRIGVWLWAIPVLLSGLLFLPLWILFLIAMAVESYREPESVSAEPLGSRQDGEGEVKKPRMPARAAEWLVDRVADHKATMLALSLLATAALALAVVIVVAFEHEGTQLTGLATELGGYVAIAGIVLGLPALGYAMVTDRAIEKLRTEVGVPAPDLKLLEEEIATILGEAATDLFADYRMQVFIPNLWRTRVVPVYDPEDVGPEDGWGVNEIAPQAITGSAWSSGSYLRATGEELQQPGLRLTEKQLKHYADLTGVAAVAITDRNRGKGERRIGVLTLSTKAPHPNTMEEAFKERHVELASSLSSVITRYVPRLGALRQWRDLDAARPS